MHFVKNLARELDTAPVAVVPFELCRIDELRGPVRTFRLKTRCRIGNKLLSSVKAKTITHTRKRVAQDAGKISLLIAFEEYGGFCRAIGRLQNHFDYGTTWRPDAKM